MPSGMVGHRSSPSTLLTRRSLRGRLAEALAALYLRAHGWSIVARRARIAGVEVDIVAARGARWAVVEVKSRRASRERIPTADLVSASQRARLETAAARLAEQRDALVRVDLIEVRWRPWPALRWHRGPFTT